MSAYVSWILRIALLVHDSHGYTRAMPMPMAQAIAEATTDRAEAALLVVLAFRESSYRHDVKGDSGRSCGAWQTPCTVTPMGAGAVRAQALLALMLYRRSSEACPRWPLAIYASGSCESTAGRRISDARMAEASALAVTP